MVAICVSLSCFHAPKLFPPLIWRVINSHRLYSSRANVGCLRCHFHILFWLPCGEEDLNKILPSLALMCARDIHLRCLFSWHPSGLALRAPLGVRLTLETGICCPVSSPCEIRLRARSLAHFARVCVCGGRWQLGSITLLSVERAWLAQWLTIHYLRLNCYHLIWKSYCGKHIWFQRQMTCFILSQPNEFTIVWYSVRKGPFSFGPFCSTCHGSVLVYKKKVYIWACCGNGIRRRCFSALASTL